MMNYATTDPRSNRRWCSLHKLVLLLALLSLSACSLSLRIGDEGTSGVVLDHETGTPLEGVIIAAYWMTEEGSLAGGSRPVEYVHFFETTTDSKGQFVVPAWKADRIFVSGNITPRFTQLLVFKPGYKLVQWQGETIKHWRPVAVTPMKDLGAEVARDAVNNALVVAESVTRATGNLIEVVVELSRGLAGKQPPGDWIAIRRWFGGGETGGDSCQWSNFPLLFGAEHAEVMRQYKDTLSKTGGSGSLPEIGHIGSIWDKQYREKISLEQDGKRYACVDASALIKMANTEK